MKKHPTMWMIRDKTGSLGRSNIRIDRLESPLPTEVLVDMLDSAWILTQVHSEQLGLHMQEGAQKGIHWLNNRGITWLMVPLSATDGAYGWRYLLYITKGRGWNLIQFKYVYL